jgi:hypothetical protein
LNTAGSFVTALFGAAVPVEMMVLRSDLDRDMLIGDGARHSKEVQREQHGSQQSEQRSRGPVWCQTSSSVGLNMREPVKVPRPEF